MRKQLALALAAAGIGIGAVALALGGTPVLAVSPTSAPSASALPAPPAGSPLATLVANGTLSGAQAAAVQNALVGYMREQWPPVTGWSNGTPPVLASDGPLAMVLSGLVQDDTLTQAQATALQNAVTQLVESRVAGGVGPWGARSGGPFGGPRGAPLWSDKSSS